MIIREENKVRLVMVESILCGSMFKAKRNKTSEYGYYIKINHHSSDIDVNGKRIFANLCLGLNVETGQIKIFKSYQEVEAIKAEVNILK